jgi:Luciferase-like monooxygenase
MWEGQAAATLHLLTRGRAILGIGTGERQGKEPYGVDWSKPVARSGPHRAIHENSSRTSQAMKPIGERAVVLGASMGGRSPPGCCRISIGPSPSSNGMRFPMARGTGGAFLRAGTGMFSVHRVRKYWIELFTGFLDELVAGGVSVWNDGDLAKVSVSFGGHRIAPSGRSPDPLSRYFNPIYGQGMTVAAVEAIVLRDCLFRGERDMPGRFYRTSARSTHRRA